MKYKEKFIELIKIYQKNQSLKAHCEFDMLISFISLMNDEHFDMEIENLLTYVSLENGLVNLHKAMRQIDFFNIGEGSGHLDMIFWNFWTISIIPAKMFTIFIDELKEDKIFESNSYKKISAKEARGYFRKEIDVFIKHNNNFIKMEPVVRSNQWGSGLSRFAKHAFQISGKRLRNNLNVSKFEYYVKKTDKISN